MHKLKISATVDWFPRMEVSPNQIKLQRSLKLLSKSTGSSPNISLSLPCEIILFMCSCHSLSTAWAYPSPKAPVLRSVALICGIPCSS
ncbi:unnamed protein product [Moneuplotes crassus]|uniref:Uncharacterized protein n=1 Tax=Euplotes crassus TaxID=5936 RepID=A0AAD1Y2E8_EUPCR|nr:unnamed protein product [Moneuplotes crassus]